MPSREIMISAIGLDVVRRRCEKGGGHWLNGPVLQAGYRLEGVNASSDWTKPNPSPPPVRILCAHDPRIFPAAIAAGYDLALAGHLHGGQCVLAERAGRLYPAIWFGKWHGLRFREQDTIMLVSRGAADTFPIRFNCPREVILCEANRP